MPKSLRFPKTKRLITASDFQQVYRNAKRITDNNITIVTKPNSLKSARIGFGFSKKKVKSAVARNTLKRLGRESFRYQHAQLPAVDIIVVANTRITTLDKQALRGTFDRLWEQLQQRYGGV